MGTSTVVGGRVILSSPSILGHLRVQTHDSGIVHHDVQAIELLLELVGEAAHASEVAVVHLPKTGPRTAGILLGCPKEASPFRGPLCLRNTHVRA